MVYVHMVNQLVGEALKWGTGRIASLTLAIVAAGLMDRQDPWRASRGIPAHQPLEQDPRPADVTA
jgi:hypothetical protein